MPGSTIVTVMVDSGLKYLKTFAPLVEDRNAAER
jgi:hypothetical protein